MPNNHQNMKGKSTLFIALGLIVALAAGSAFYFSSGSDLQGRFGSALSSPGGTWSLSSSSPAGTRSVSSSDEFIVFDITAPSTKAVEFDNFTDSFKVLFETASGDIDESSAGTEVSLYMDGMSDRVGYGYIVTDYEEPETDIAAATIYFTWGVSVDPGDTQTFTLETNTSALMAEDSGADDELEVQVKYVTTMGAKEVTGNTLKY